MRTAKADASAELAKAGQHVYTKVYSSTARASLHMAGHPSHAEHSNASNNIFLTPGRTARSLIQQRAQRLATLVKVEEVALITLKTGRQGVNRVIPAAVTGDGMPALPPDTYLVKVADVEKQRIAVKKIVYAGASSDAVLLMEQLLASEAVSNVIWDKTANDFNKCCPGIGHHPVDGSEWSGLG